MKDDLISKTAAIKTAERMYKRCDTSSVEDYHDLMVDALTELPSAQLAQDLTNGCTDTISRQAALDALNVSMIFGRCNEKTVTFEALKKYAEGVRERIDALPPAQPGWIPVTEILPKYGEVVLWCNQQGSVFTSAITWQRGNDYGVGQHYGVTAWMPLPAPYQEKDEKEDV